MDAGEGLEVVEARRVGWVTSGTVKICVRARAVQVERRRAMAMTIANPSWLVGDTVAADGMP